MGLTVEELGDADDPRWNAYVAGHPDATLYHTLAWRDLVAGVFGHRPRYLVAVEGNACVGVLPLFRVRFPILGTKLLSLPYDIGSGGALANDAAAERELVSRAIAIARDEGAAYLELRGESPSAVLEELGFRLQQPALISTVVLDDADAVRGRIARGERKCVRQAARRGVSVRIGETGADYAAFYDVYTRAFRALGTPPYAARYFMGVFERLHAGGGARLFLAEHEGRAVGGMLLFVHPRTIVAKIGGARPGTPGSLKVFPALYGAALEFALESGAARLSWGTSTASQAGLIEFKERWAGVARPACVYGLPLSGSLPDLSRYYDSEGLPQRAWKRLPLAVTRWLGPPLNRWFC